MIDALRLYRLYVGISVRGQMQYRASFGHGYDQPVRRPSAQSSSASWCSSAALDTLEGWRLPQVAFLYGLVHLGFSFADTFSRGFDSFGLTVRMGDFDRLLLRPRSTALQLMGKELVAQAPGPDRAGARGDRVGQHRPGGRNGRR